MSFNVTTLVASFEIAMAIAGVVLLWRLVLSPTARAAPPPPALARWNATFGDFVIFLVFIIGGSFVAAAVASLMAKTLGLRGDAMTVFTGSGAQLGMLGGVWFYWSGYTRTSSISTVKMPRSAILTAGAATFLVSVPLLLITAKLSEVLVDALGLPTERQSLIAMFANADSPLLLAIMIALAIVIAPLTEELVFRAGLFRYLRSRVPGWAAFGVSALLFASLHVNWVTLEGLTSFLPLAALAVMFSFAYERTGSIGTPIVAHALFNLNTIVLIFSGLGT
jgi:uncharacterized protein